MNLSWFEKRRMAKQWDETLNAFLDTGRPVENVDEYTCIMGRVEVWISESSYPHSYGRPYRVRDNGSNYARDLPEGMKKIIPKRRTRKRLRAKVRESVGLPPDQFTELCTRVIIPPLE